VQFQPRPPFHNNQNCKTEERPQDHGALELLTMQLSSYALFFFMLKVSKLKELFKAISSRIRFLIKSFTLWSLFYVYLIKFFEEKEHSEFNWGYSTI